MDLRASADPECPGSSLGYVRLFRSLSLSVDLVHSQLFLNLVSNLRILIMTYGVIYVSIS